MKIAIGNDHVAVELKHAVAKHLKELGHEVINIGTDETSSTDYPNYAKEVSLLVQQKKVDFGVLICGTGVGMSITANKFKGVRAVVCSEPFSAKASREHNNSNVLCFGARVVGLELALMIVDSFFNASFLGERHLRRVHLIDKIEEEN